MLPSMANRSLTLTVALLDAARRGDKIQTLRAWAPRFARWEAGDRLRLHAYGWAEPVRSVVESVRRVEVSELTWEDALYDGFDSLEELREALGSMGVDGPLARVRFHRVSMTSPACIALGYRRPTQTHDAVLLS